MKKSNFKNGLWKLVRATSGITASYVDVETGADPILSGLFNEIKGHITVADLVRYINRYVFENRIVGASWLFVMYKEIPGDVAITPIGIKWLGDRYEIETLQNRFKGGYSDITKKKLKYIDVVHTHPVLSVSAIDAVICDARGELYDEYLYLESDEIEIYKKVLLREYNRYPSKFFDNLRKEQVSNMCKYFIKFYLGHDEASCIETTMKDIIRGRMLTLYNIYQHSIHAIISEAFPAINPWEMVKTASGTFTDYEQRMAAINFYLGMVDPIDIRVKDIKGVAPGIFGFYSKNGMGIDDIRNDIREWRNNRQ